MSEANVWREKVDSRRSSLGMLLLKLAMLSVLASLIHWRPIADVQGDGQGLLVQSEYSSFTWTSLFNPRKWRELENAKCMKNTLLEPRLLCMCTPLAAIIHRFTMESMKSIPPWEEPQHHQSLVFLSQHFNRNSLCYTSLSVSRTTFTKEAWRKTWVIQPRGPSWREPGQGFKLKHGSEELKQMWRKVVSWLASRPKDSYLSHPKPEDLAR